MGWNQIEILALPESCLLERRLTKAFFLKNFQLKSAEKKILSEHIKSMHWLASLKPSTTNILPFQSEDYIFDELQVFTVDIDESSMAKYKAIMELIHKHIPYQILLILRSDQSLIYSVCDKRINQADPSKRTIASYTQTPIINMLYHRDVESSFAASLSFASLQKDNLRTSYQSYVNAIVQYATAKITGSYTVRDHARTAQDLQTIKQIEQLEAEIVSLRSQIKKAQAFREKTELNVDLQQKKATIKELQKTLAI